jgi:hypothetical protein
MPRGVGRVVLEMTRPQHVRHGRSTQGQARVAGVCLLYGVHRQDADRIDVQLVKSSLGMVDSLGQRDGHRIHHALTSSRCFAWSR